MTQAWRSFGDLLPVAVVAVLVGVGLVIVGWRGTARTRSVVVLILLGLWALMFAAVTLKPSGGLTSRSVDLMPLRDIFQTLRGIGGASQSMAQLAGNVLMALPAGVLLRVHWGSGRRSLSRTVVATAAFCVLIESLQWVLGVGRATTVDDVLLGVAGSTLGWVLCQLCYSVRGNVSRGAPRKPRATAPVR